MFAKIKDFFYTRLKTFIATCKDIFTNKHLLIWSCVYFIVIYLIFRILFRFDILFNFSHLSRINLHGFFGFIFGAILISALPLYLASASLIKRTKKPLISIKKVPEKNKNKEEKQTNIAPVKSDAKFPEKLPEELHEPYIRMQRGQLMRANSYLMKNPIADLPKDETNKEDETVDIGNIPLPEDFDTESDNYNKTLSIPDFESTPTFREISFNKQKSEKNISLNQPKFLKNLIKNGYLLEKIGNITVASLGSETLAIVIHDDQEFWIPDDNGDWFANGQQKTSPITELLNVANMRSASPVFVLTHTNILNFDECKSRWEGMGIKVIMDK